jgi:hypothetical protein
MGIANHRVFARFGVSGVDEINLAHVEELLGLHTAIKDGELDADAEFPEMAKPSPKMGDDIAPKVLQ